MKSKVPNAKWTRGDERTSPLDHVSQISLGRGKREGATEKEKENVGFLEREALPSL